MRRCGVRAGVLDSKFDLIALTARVPVVAGDHGGKAARQVKVLETGVPPSGLVDRGNTRRG